MEISVVIPTYNRYELLKRAITSVLTQTYSVREIIVIDDGSCDKTSYIKKDFPSIRYIYQKNEGVSSARNRGIKEANYEWIAFLDSDDEWLKDKLEEQVKFHKQNRNILMSYTDENWIKDDIAVKIPKKFHKIGKDIFMENLSYCNIAPSSTIIHKKLLNDIGVFDESLEVCEDYDLWLRVACNHKIGFINKKLINKYAGHDKQLSFKHWGMDRFRVITLEKILITAKREQKIAIKKELIKKYTLLLKGAIKYDKIPDIKLYMKKLDFFEEFGSSELYR